MDGALASAVRPITRGDLERVKKSICQEMQSLGALMRERFQSHLVKLSPASSGQTVSGHEHLRSSCASMHSAAEAGRERTSPEKTASNSTATSALATLDVVSPPPTVSRANPASTAAPAQLHTPQHNSHAAKPPLAAVTAHPAPVPVGLAPAPPAAAAQTADAGTASSQAAPAAITCDELEAMFRSAIASDGDVLTRWADELARRMWAQTPTPSATPRSIGSPAYCASSALSYAGSAASTVARNSPAGSCPASPDRRWRSQQHPRSPDLLLSHQHHQHHQHHQRTSCSHHGGHQGQQLPHGRSRLGGRSSGGGAPLAVSGPLMVSGMADASDVRVHTRPVASECAVLYQAAATPTAAAAAAAAAAVAPELVDTASGGAAGQASAGTDTSYAQLPQWQQHLDLGNGTGPDSGLVTAAHGAVGAAMPRQECDEPARKEARQAAAELPAEQAPAWPVAAGVAAGAASTASAPSSPARRELPAQVVEEVKRRYLEGCGPHMLLANSAAAAAAAAAMTPRHASLSTLPALEAAAAASAPAAQGAGAALPAPVAGPAASEPVMLPAAFEPACWPAEAAFPLGALAAEPLGNLEGACAAGRPASFAAMLPPPPQARPASGTHGALIAADASDAAPGATGSAAAASVAVALLRGLRAGMPAPPLPKQRVQAAASDEADGEGSEGDEEAWELYQQDLFRQTQHEFKVEEEAAGSVASQKAPLLQPSQSSAASCASPSASSYSFGSATTSSYSRGYFALPSPYDNSCFPPASPHGVRVDGHAHTAASYYATPASSSFARKSSEIAEGCGTGTSGGTGSASSGNGMHDSGSSPVGKGGIAQDAVFGAWVSAASP